MTEFFQTNLLAIILLVFLIVLAIIIVVLKIDLKKDGKNIVFVMIALSLIAGLLLMQATELKAILIKVFVMLTLLFGCFMFYKYLKLK